MHSAQRKVTDLQTHLKVLESKLAEKDTEIRLLQEKKSMANEMISISIDKLIDANYICLHKLVQPFAVRRSTRTTASA